MSTKISRQALGRGLSALISNSDALDRTITSSFDGSAALAASPDAGTISVALIDTNPDQPRQVFIESEINELAHSIRTLGILQPVLLRPHPSKQGRFELVAGERRFRAAQLAGIQEIPANIKTLNDRQVLEIALVENVQRSNLNPIEEAGAYERLMTQLNLSQVEIADRVGKDRTTVANLVRLLKLPQEVRDMIQAGTLSTGHAKAILAIRDPAAQVNLARKTISAGLSVRALETLIAQALILDNGKKAPINKPAQSSKSNNLDSGMLELADRLRRKLGTKVSIQHTPGGRGRIEIDYFSDQELERLVEAITG